MKIYRSTMEKILDQQEQNEIITDPKHPVKTFFRKMHYRLTVWNHAVKKIILKQKKMF